MQMHLTGGKLSESNIFLPPFDFRSGYWSHSSDSQVCTHKEKREIKQHQEPWNGNGFISVV